MAAAAARPAAAAAPPPPRVRGPVMEVHRPCGSHVMHPRWCRPPGGGGGLAAARVRSRDRAGRDATAPRSERARLRASDPSTHALLLRCCTGRPRGRARERCWCARRRDAHGVQYAASECTHESAHRSQRRRARRCSGAWRLSKAAARAMPRWAQFPCALPVLVPLSCSARNTWCSTIVVVCLRVGSGFVGYVRDRA